MLCSYITWLGSDPFRSSFASGFCLHGRGGRNERECFGCQHRATRFGRNARHHVHRLPNFNGSEASVSAALRPKRSHVNALLDSIYLRLQSRLICNQYNFASIKENYLYACDFLTIEPVIHEYRKCKV